mmetsp:Transcript_44467/g.71279  ORF Transcript_44467/g.71279 Transcript_44467/m.71279 type:complete len:127 (-) Transcript_44467:27-407(-)
MVFAMKQPCLHITKVAKFASLWFGAWISAKVGDISMQNKSKEGRRIRLNRRVRGTVPRRPTRLSRKPESSRRSCSARLPGEHGKLQDCVVGTWNYILTCLFGLMCFDNLPSVALLVLRSFVPPSVE